MQISLILRGTSLWQLNSDISSLFYLKVLGVRAIRDIYCGEEYTVNYKYSLKDAPLWYQVQPKRMHQYDIRYSLKNAPLGH